MSNIKQRRGRVILSVLAVISFLLVLCSTDAAIEYMKKGLSLCASSVIPSLFPFMVISEIIVSSGVGVRISRLFAKPMRYLFGVSEAGAAVYILGAVCGFPIGAKTAVSMYEKGIMTKPEVERLMTFCNNPGSAFVISAIGVSLLGSKKIGILLYICIILSSVIVGMLGKYFWRDRKKSFLQAPMLIPCELDVKTVTSAVSSSALSMLTVCAYVTFFSALVGCLGSLLSHFSLPNEILACIFGFFELSSGVGTAAELGNPLHATLFCALFSGWSGLSVHFQIMTVCSSRDISCKPYIIAKAVQSVICAALMMLLMKTKIFNPNTDITLPNAPTYSHGFLLSSLTALVTFVAVIVIVVAVQIKKISCKKNPSFGTKKEK